MRRPTLALALWLALAPVAGPIAQAAAPAAGTAARGEHRDYIAEVRANFTPENRAYSSARTRLAFVEPFYEIAVVLLVLFTGIAARIRDLAHRVSPRRYVRALVYVAVYGAAAFVLTLPLDFYEGFVLEHRYGLSNQSAGAWLGDEIKLVLFQTFFLGVVPVVAWILRAIEHQPRRWWIRLTIFAAPFAAASYLVTPLVIEPAFNKFTPLSNLELRDKILALGARAGIPARKVLEANRSAQTNKINAYVSGFGPSQRIVLWDTTLKSMSEDEILFVMGHEMGHYKLHHIWKGIAWIVLFSGVTFYLVAMLAPPLARRFGPRWGFDALHDLAAVPLLLGLVTLVLFVLSPAINAVERGIEHDADVYAVEITRDNDAGARSFLKLGAQNRSNPEPSPIVKLFLFDHPPLIERIRFALEYRPWEQGRPNRLFHGAPAAAGKSP